MESIRKISLVLLFSLSLVMFNKFFPHHHHMGEVCFVNAHCENDHGTHTPAMNHNASDHDHHGDAENCRLNSYFIASSKQNLHTKKEAGGYYLIPVSGLLNKDDNRQELPCKMIRSRHSGDPPLFDIRILVRAVRAPPAVAAA